MSLAEEMRKKAEDARHQKEQVSQLTETQRTELALEEAKAFLKRTKRLATSRLSRLTQLIDGAASLGKNSLEYPSSWVPSGDILETKIIFGKIAEGLLEKGFRVIAKEEAREVIKPFKLSSGAIHGINLNRLVLTIHWN